MKTNSTPNIIKTIRFITWVGFWCNAFLMALKLIVGYIGHSDALVADGVHSLSDFATDIIVLLFVGMAYKGADLRHPYGHGKYETFATLLIATILFFVGIGVGYEGINSIKSYCRGQILPRPDIWTIIVALISILTKEWLYHFTYNTGKKTKSISLIANAWHHRTDALSSVATLIGVSAGFFLGISWRILDPIAAIIIAILISVSAIKIALPSIQELMDIALPPKQIKEIEQAIKSVPGVLDYHHLRTRKNGQTYIISLHIKVSPTITVTAGHNIATHVEQAIKNIVGNDAIIYVHVEPHTTTTTQQ